MAMGCLSTSYRAPPEFAAPQPPRETLSASSALLSDAPGALDAMHDRAPDALLGQLAAGGAVNDLGRLLDVPALYLAVSEGERGHSTSEVARADLETRASYEAELRAIVEAVADGLQDKSAKARRERAIITLVLLSGGVSLARAVNDPAFSREIARAIRRALVPS